MSDPEIPRITLPKLSSELILEIAAHLPPRAKLALAAASRSLHALLTPLSRHDKLRVLLDLERAAPPWHRAPPPHTRRGPAHAYIPHPLFRACAHCLQLLPFYHFSAGNYARRGRPRQRRCLACWEAQLARAGPRRNIPWIMGLKARVCAHCRVLVALHYDNLVPNHGCGAACAACGCVPAGAACGCLRPSICSRDGVPFTGASSPVGINVAFTGV